MIAGGLVLLVASAVTGELATFNPAAVSTESWVGIAYLLLVGSLVGYTTFAWLVQVAPLPRVATYAYVNPVVAVILGAIVLQEPLSPRTWVASVVIIAAVVLIVTAAGACPAGRDVDRHGTRRARRRPGLGAGRRLRAGPSPSAAGRLRQHRARDAPGPDHRRDHRVDPERRREQRGVAHVEPVDDPVAARTSVCRRTRPHGSHA